MSWGERLERVTRQLGERLLRRDAERRYYGGEMTIHQTGYIDVEVHRGRVVAVWFRCTPLPFEVHEVDDQRSMMTETMYRSSPPIALVGVTLEEES